MVEATTAGIRMEPQEAPPASAGIYVLQTAVRVDLEIMEMAEAAVLEAAAPEAEPAETGQRMEAAAEVVPVDLAADREVHIPALEGVQMLHLHNQLNTR